ncbi:MarR family winged helix-turn-helix transcriptional regulator [Motilibacter aurantiacus]|uniref:MarR family winged helix-turn-helix transcriptional regulator n=1 Tax=Motilibacter aurantiacus TaxID=2714955 RepID=UPI00140A17C8|nr:MarR family transcriptional regulator [Motilibacter aurantiacus]NHC44301.1 MarR family transcriptional regulator [Motilibacter aurantiacus]
MHTLDQELGMDPGVDAEAYRALEHELAVFLRRARAASKELAREVHPDMEPDAYGLLVRLSESEGSRGTDLAAYFGVGKPTISRQVRLLEELGLVRRTPDPSDGRAFLLVLTEEGARRLAPVREARRRIYRQMLDSWPTEDVAKFAELLGRLNAAG